MPAVVENAIKDALSVLRERTSVNLFDPTRKISDEEIREIIADATQAPSSYNIQHWRFIAVTDPEKKKQLQAAAYNQAKVGQASATIIVLGDLRGYEKLEKIYEPLVKRGTVTKEYVAGAVRNSTAAYSQNPQFQRDEAIRSGALAAMTLMIAAQARGYVTGPMIGFDPEQVKKLFNISDRYVPVMLITLGYPAPETSRASRGLGSMRCWLSIKARNFSESCVIPSVARNPYFFHTLSGSVGISRYARNDRKTHTKVPVLRSLRPYPKVTCHPLPAKPTISQPLL